MDTKLGKAILFNDIRNNSKMYAGISCLLSFLLICCIIIIIIQQIIIYANVKENSKLTSIINNNKLVCHTESFKNITYNEPKKIMYKNPAKKIIYRNPIKKGFTPVKYTPTQNFSRDKNNHRPYRRVIYEQY